MPRGWARVSLASSSPPSAMEQPGSEVLSRVYQNSLSSASLHRRHSLGGTQLSFGGRQLVFEAEQGPQPSVVNDTPRAEDDTLADALSPGPSQQEESSEDGLAGFSQDSVTVRTPTPQVTCVKVDRVAALGTKKFGALDLGKRSGGVGEENIDFSGDSGSQQRLSFGAAAVPDFLTEEEEQLALSTCGSLPGSQEPFVAGDQYPLPELHSSDALASAHTLTWLFRDLDSPHKNKRASRRAPSRMEGQASPASMHLSPVSSTAKTEEMTSPSCVPALLEPERTPKAAPISKRRRAAPSTQRQKRQCPDQAVTGAPKAPGRTTLVTPTPSRRRGRPACNHEPSCETEGVTRKKSRTGTCLHCGIPIRFCFKHGIWHSDNNYSRTCKLMDSRGPDW